MKAVVKLHALFDNPRQKKFCEAKDRFEQRNGGHKRFSEVNKDYSNLATWVAVMECKNCMPLLKTVLARWW